MPGLVEVLKVSTQLIKAEVCRLLHFSREGSRPGRIYAGSSVVVSGFHAGASEVCEHTSGS